MSRKRPEGIYFGNCGVARRRQGGWSCLRSGSEGGLSPETLKPPTRTGWPGDQEGGWQAEVETRTYKLSRKERSRNWSQAKYVPCQDDKCPSFFWRWLMQRYGVILNEYPIGFDECFKWMNKKTWILKVKPQGKM